MSSKLPILSDSSEEEIERDEETDDENNEEVKNDENPDSKISKANHSTNRDENGRLDFDSNSTTSSHSSPEKSNSSCGDDDFRVEPIVSKSIDANAKTTDNDVDDALLMPTNRLMKRPNKAFESGNEQNKKKKKKKNKVSDYDEEEEGPRRKLVVGLPSDEPRKWIPRIWDESDEIVMLQGMIDYIENGGNPYVDADGFLVSIKKSLHFNPTVKQLKSKIVKLKTKYDNIAKKAKADVEDPVIANPHELRSYGLWKQIWGPKDGKSSAVVGPKKRKEKFKSHNEMGVDVNQKLSLKALKPRWSLFPCLNDLMGLDLDSFRALSDPGERVMKENSGLVEKRKLQVEDVQAYLKWIDLLREKVMKIHEILEASDSLGLFEVPGES